MRRFNRAARRPLEVLVSRAAELFDQTVRLMCVVGAWWTRVYSLQLCPVLIHPSCTNVEYKLL